MVIRVLTFEGCPNCEAAIDLVQKTVRDLHLQADIEAIQVNSENEAKRYHFLGSPTIQVNGRDIEVNRRNEKASYACRVYRITHGFTGVPPRQLLMDAISEAQRVSP
jgi:glutaredoxin